MTTYHWFLPTGGDGREVGAVTALQARSARSTARPADLDYLTQVAAAAERSGFAAVLTPTGAGCEDAWVACAAVATQVRALEFLVAFRPGFLLPTLAARQAATFQHMTGGRLRLNIVTGGDPVEQRAFGDHVDHDERYARTDEFIEVLRRCFDDAPFDHRGAHYAIDGGGLVAPSPRPPIYFGGASPAAERVAAARADVYLTWGEPPDMVRPRLERVRGLADAVGRPLRFGIRLHVIARETPEAAWAEAHRLLDAMDPAAIAASQQRFARMDSVGQSRMADLHGGRTDDLEVSPGLWAGIGLVREGAATALVGSYEQVAERIEEYRALGFDEFILSGYPHLEEAYRFGELVRPLLDAGPSAHADEAARGGTAPGAAAVPAEEDPAGEDPAAEDRRSAPSAEWMWTVARRVAASTVPCSVPYGPTPGAPFDELRLRTANSDVSVLGWAPGATATQPPGVGVLVVVAGTIAVEQLDDDEAAPVVLHAGEGIAPPAGAGHRIGNVGTGPATTVHVTEALRCSTTSGS